MQRSTGRGGQFDSPSKAAVPKRRESPMKQDDEEELTRAFKETIRLESELEDSKVKLSMQPDYNLMDGF